MIFSHGKHARKRRTVRMFIIGLALVTAILSSLSFTPAARASISPGNAALNWAESQAGKPYIWGGTGPWGYDCSGLVVAAFEHAGIQLPRTTYGMLSSWHLVPVSNPQRGDLAFYGSGHVEIVTGWGAWSTFGAEEPGTDVGWHQGSQWWHPDMYFEVR